ncbi:MAG: ABC transporter substrate-binding protein [Planctomycetota bacterium]|jgi:branched-chain amino acid transport system substrate-binding protein
MRAFVTLSVAVAMSFATFVLADSRETQSVRQRSDEPPTTARIGVLLPLSGKKAPIGLQQRRAFELAEERLNANSGIKVNFLFEDTKSDAKVGQDGARKLIGEKGVSILFAFPCAVVYKVQPIADKAGVLLMACNMDPRTAQTSPHTFRVFPNLQQQTLEMLGYLGKGNGKRVAVIRLRAPSPDYAVTELLLPALEANDWQVATNATFSMKIRDYESVVAQVKAGNPDVVLMYVDNEAAPSLLRLLKQKALLGKVRIVGGISFAFPFKLPSQMLEGVTVIAPTCALSGRPKLETSWLAQEFRKRHGKPPHIFGAFCFDGAMLVGHALKAEGIGTADVQAHLRSVKGYPGVTGSITFDEKGDAGVDWSVGVYRNGKLVPIPENN